MCHRHDLFLHAFRHPLLPSHLELFNNIYEASDVLTEIGTAGVTFGNLECGHAQITEACKSILAKKKAPILIYAM